MSKLKLQLNKTIAEETKTNSSNNCPSPVKLVETVYRDYPEGINFPCLCSIFSMDQNRADRRRFLRFVKKQKFYLIIKKTNDLIWIYPRFNRLDLREVDLKYDVQNVNQYAERKFGNLVQNLTQDSGLHSIKLDACRFVSSTSWGNKGLSPQALEALKKHFEAYNEDSQNLLLVFEYRKEDRYLILPYETRFNSQPRIDQRYAIYNQAWEKAEKDHDKGVFLTLTTDPKNFSSLWEAVQNLTEAWKKFFMWVKKRLSFKPDYVKGLEFTKSGLPHLHILIFGVDRIAGKDEITRAWARTGQGKTNYLYPVCKNQKGRWVWKSPKNKPEDAKKDVKTYMKKEIGKSLNYQGTLALYWITNRRFFTVSKGLRLTDEEKKELGIKTRTQKVKEDPVWEFVGTFPRESIPVKYVEGSEGVPPPPQSPAKAKEFLKTALGGEE